MQLPGLFPDYFAVGLRKTEGWLTFSGLWLSVISNAKPDLRDIRDPEKKRAAQGRTAQVTEGTLKAKVQRRGNARGSLDRTSLRPECDFTGEITLAFTGIAPLPFPIAWAMCFSADSTGPRDRRRRPRVAKPAQVSANMSATVALVSSTTPSTSRRRAAHKTASGLRAAVPAGLD